MVTYSGTYDFAPSLGEITINAFARIQVRRSEILQSHLQDAQMEANLLLSRFSGLQPNLWTVGQQAVPLLQGIATYSVPAETAMILDIFIRVGNTDRIITPISRTEYSSYPNKDQQGYPTVFWFDRLISPTITFWTVPDGGGPYTAYYYSVRQVQDAQFANGLNVEVPYLWLDAYTAALAHRLSRIYAPQLEQIRKADADEAWLLASTQDVEAVPLYIMPQTGGYFR